MNFFQPSFKLIGKTRDGATTVKRYSQPTTPCDLLIEHDVTGDEVEDALKEYRARLDPVLLLHTIREAQSALVAATAPEVRETPSSESLSRFLTKLPTLWRHGEARPTHAARVRSPRHCGPERSLRGCSGRRTGVVAGRTGCHWQGADGKVAIGTPGPVHRGTVANHAVQNERVAGSVPSSSVKARHPF